MWVKCKLLMLAKALVLMIRLEAVDTNTETTGLSSLKDWKVWVILYSQQKVFLCDQIKYESNIFLSEILRECLIPITGAGYNLYSSFLYSKVVTNQQAGCLVLDINGNFSRSMSSPMLRNMKSLGLCPLKAIRQNLSYNYRSQKL